MFDGTFSCWWLPGVGSWHFVLLPGAWQRVRFRQAKEEEKKRKEEARRYRKTVLENGDFTTRKMVILWWFNSDLMGFTLW